MFGLEELFRFEIYDITCRKNIEIKYLKYDNLERSATHMYGT